MSSRVVPLVCWWLLSLGLGAIEAQTLSNESARTLYLENPGSVGAWRSNPALCAGICGPLFLSTNVLPLGNRYTLSTIRFITPMGTHWYGGIGVLGVSTLQNRSSQVTDAGLSYADNFSFSRPTLDMCLAYTSERFGAIGLLAGIGSEKLNIIASSRQTGAVFLLSPGLLTPWFIDRIRGSISLTLSKHSLDEATPENYSKLGILVRSADSVFIGSLEYTVHFGDGFGVFGVPQPLIYDVATCNVSIRLAASWAVLMGLSYDTPYPFDNHLNIHCGLEARPLADWPFFGGYQIGSNRNLNLLHRVWLGYHLGKSTHLQK